MPRNSQMYAPLTAYSTTLFDIRITAMRMPPTTPMTMLTMVSQIVVHNPVKIVG